MILCNTEVSFFTTSVSPVPSPPLESPPPPPLSLIIYPMMMMTVSLFSASSAKVDHCLPQLLLAYAPVVVVVEHPDNKMLIKHLKDILQTTDNNVR